ncbi:MAG TPA: hypothetical protein PLD20_08735 [Blastocatellia bacterium]|nr:hypothetical protein [Blastocatellia bacterium]HMV83681.1 hypothetical protein [Blastocatellia bacterium]HMX24349.1 hypothetical protein [Blastocatellia bacterium]HMY70928.1 hypothetical protein [Blastocatellia bacterium]HMZ18001.1 hypothetical protein [Blastocatellia bacterium]
MTGKLTKIILSVAFVMTVLPAASWAQDHGINERQREQQQRIRQGVRSGELTHSEARRLAREEARIHRQEARARRSGGQFTPRERARIQRELNQANRHIYRQKHDRQDRR